MCSEKKVGYQISPKSELEKAEKKSKLNSGLNQAKTRLVYKWGGLGLKHDQWS